MEIAFYILAGMAVTSAILVVSLKNLVRAILALASLFLSIAGLYILLSAEFLGLVQILVYIGGVILLFLFLIMLTENLFEKNKVNLFQRITGVGLVLLLFSIIISIFMKQPFQAIPKTDYSIQELGKHLLTDYLVPFEVVSLLLLVALIGAIVIAKKEENK
ncbi:MAG: NADH-quinone oxidoreductase subunit J [bacterium]|nr:NADH-quinone oxidoreductase subunit J [bacterium]